MRVTYLVQGDQASARYGVAFLGSSCRMVALMPQVSSLKTGKMLLEMIMARNYNCTWTLPVIDTPKVDENVIGSIPLSSHFEPRAWCNCRLESTMKLVKLNLQEFIWSICHTRMTFGTSKRYYVEPFDLFSYRIRKCLIIWQMYGDAENNMSKASANQIQNAMFMLKRIDLKDFTYANYSNPGKGFTNCN